MRKFRAGRKFRRGGYRHIMRTIRKHGRKKFNKVRY